ncbi:hypothetical protein J0H58_27755 [bacterium]|nr:hypothetical protein [bacterium]
MLAVCRRLTRHAQDAEDAFQAVFVVLARKADRLSPADSVGGWLVGVAGRVARKAAGRAWRRRGREAVGGELDGVPARLAEPVDPEAARAVIEEVGRLPDVLRGAVVLCELEGRPRAAAARELGVAEGTLSSRLAAARKRLATRLRARGYGPAALAALVGVAVPLGLTAAASVLGSGAPVSPAVAALAHGVGRAMIPCRIPVASLVLTVIASAALTVGLPSGPPAPPAVRAAGPAPRAAVGPNRIVVMRKGELVGVDPDGRNLATILPARPGHFVSPFAVSPNGHQVAVVELNPAVFIPDTEDGRLVRAGFYRLFVRGLRAEHEPVELGVFEHPTTAVWSPTGLELLVATGDEDRPTGPHSRHFLVHTGTKARTELKLPDNHVVIDWSRDGRRFLTAHTVNVRGDNRNGQVTRLGLVNRDGTGARLLTGADDWCRHARFSPDGTRALAWVRRGAAPVPGTLEVLDLGTGQATRLPGWPRAGGGAPWCCWSPDGRQVAYVKSYHPVSPALPEGRGPNGPVRHYWLVVADADGQNPRSILSVSGQWTNDDLMWGIDWR